MDAGDSFHQKRKRSHEDTFVPITHSAPHTPTPGVTQINYLVKAKSEKLRLIDGDTEPFSDVLALIDDYEGVLQRHESLAANMGAKLVGSIVFKSFEKLFEGYIKILNPKPHYTTVTWLDIVELARTNPKAFQLVTDERNGTRLCHVWVKDLTCEILEDDYRLILSGGPERMIPTYPIADDEVSELGTIEILEQRLAILIKKADLVAGRARMLNHHLKGRRTAIQASRAPEQGSAERPDSHSSTFQSPYAPIVTAAEKQALHNDLMRQFLIAEDRKGVPTRTSRVRQPSESGSPGLPSTGRRLSQPYVHSQTDDGTGGPLRPIMTQLVERKFRGDAIWPPCDRCRRLRMDCKKHLTACVGCTKKHARCAWKDLTEQESAQLMQLVANEGMQPILAQQENMNLNLDPGLRSNGSGSGMDMSSVGHTGEVGGMFMEQGMAVEGGNDTRKDELHPDEAIMISQMAAAAAASANGSS